MHRSSTSPPSAPSFIIASLGGRTSSSPMPVCGDGVKHHSCAADRGSSGSRSSGLFLCETCSNCRTFTTRTGSTPIYAHQSDSRAVVQLYSLSNRHKRTFETSLLLGASRAENGIKVPVAGRTYRPFRIGGTRARYGHRTARLAPGCLSVDFGSCNIPWEVAVLPGGNLDYLVRASTRT